MIIIIRRMSTGYWQIRGQGPCNWAQPMHWPCDETMLRESAFPQASEAFIAAALGTIRGDCPNQERR